MSLESWIKVGSVIWPTSVRFIDVPSHSPPFINGIIWPANSNNQVQGLINIFSTYIFLFAGPAAHRWNFPSAPDAQTAAGFDLNVSNSLNCVGENEYEKSSKLLQNY